MLRYSPPFLTFHTGNIISLPYNVNKNALCGGHVCQSHRGAQGSTTEQSKCGLWLTKWH
jgi:hypothetical protein